ncbi:NADPH--quinone reductase [Mycobacteroides abscessus subsp. abscessus]|nr:NADPH--quinone reductase [Mycobacteroides abscessus subsp. abscessus]
MRAIEVPVTGGPEVLTLVERADPAPGPAEVLIDVDAVGVNFRDIYLRNGSYTAPLPHIPGSEVSGVVRAVGEGVQNLAPGDRVASPVAAWGYAESTTAPADYTAKVPAGLSAEVAASSLLQGITAHYLLTSVYPVAAGDTVLVHAGAGGMGLLLTQWATYRGVRVITTVSSEAKEKLSREAGAAEVLPYPDPTDPSEFASQIRELTAGEGVAVVYDGVGKSTFEASLAAVRVRGLIALYGAASGQVPPFDPQRLTAKSAVLTRPTMGHFIRTPEEFAWRADDVLDLVSRGTLKITVGASYALDQAAQAHIDLEARKTTGSVVLVP